MSKHTPGPWIAGNPTDALHAIRGPNNQIVADVGYSGTLGGDIANANLISAAPDLMAALIPFARVGLCANEVPHDFGLLVLRARAAIAKATGVTL